MSNPVATKLAEEQLIPDIFPSVPGNVGLVTVIYPTTGQVTLGKEITPLAAKEQPHVLWVAENDQLYTLILTDPDVPSRSNPKKTQVKHWLVVNIPGNQVDKGHVESEYFGPGPEKGSGLHRYTFLVFKQKGKMWEHRTVPFNELRGRFLFDARNFAEEHNLGEPIAVNFFQAEYDDSVPAVLANFKKFPTVVKNICPLINYKCSRIFK